MTNSWKVAALFGVLSLVGCGEGPRTHARATGGTGGLGEAESASRFTRYVALGDSYVSGDGNWDYASWDRCKRSPNSWPQLVNQQLAKQGTTPTFVLAGCSGAVIDQVRSEQLPMIKPANANTLVTVTVGGNDLKISSELGNCLLSSKSCVSRRGALVNTINETATRLTALYRDVKEAANGGTVIATGYPLLVTADAHLNKNCKSLDADEVKMIRELITLMNQRIAQAAKDAGIPSVTTELEEAFAGREACAASERDRWINGGSGLWDAAKLSSLLHPNLNGNRAYMATVVAALNKASTVSHVIDEQNDAKPPATPVEPLDPESASEDGPSLGEETSEDSESSETEVAPAEGDFSSQDDDNSDDESHESEGDDEDQTSGDEDEV